MDDTISSPNEISERLGRMLETLRARTAMQTPAPPETPRPTQTIGHAEPKKSIKSSVRPKKWQSRPGYNWLTKGIPNGDLDD